MERNGIRPGLMSWIVLPALTVWLSVGYVMGLASDVSWDRAGSVRADEIELEKVLAKVKDSKFGHIIEPEQKGQGMVTLWFDDAWESQFSNTLEVMNEKGFEGVVAVPTGMIGLEGYMDWAEVRRLAFDGWEVASHGVSHDCKLPEEDLEVFEAELIESQFQLSRHGLQAGHFVAPCGVHSDEGDELVYRYYDSQRLTLRGINRLPLFDEYRIKVEQVDIKTDIEKVREWIGVTEDLGGWLNLMFHQIDNEGRSLSVEPEMLGKILDELNESDLRVVSATEALEENEKRL